MNPDLMPCANGCARADGAPYPAHHGNYCNRCFGRIDIPLITAGELAQHLLGNALTSRGAGDEKVDTSSEADVPFNQGAFDDVNDLFAGLAHWARVWAAHLHQQAPAAAASGWRNARGVIIGLDADTTPETGAKKVQDIATWLRVRLDDILTTTHTDDITGLMDTMSNVWRINASWPRVARPEYSSVTCREDDCNRRIAVFPPAFPGDERRISCDAGHWYPEEEYEHLILVFQEEAKERKKTKRIADRLAKRYGIGLAV
jgi:hypothetical protein